MKENWKIISDNSEKKKKLQKRFRSFLRYPKKNRFLDSNSPLSSIQTIISDHLNSPDFWKNKHTRIFGKTKFYLEKCAVVFASIVFVKVILGCLLLTTKALYVHKVTSRPLQFGKILLSVSYNMLFLSIVTSIFPPE